MSSRFESDSKEGLRLVTGDSKQGSQKEDNLTSTGSPRSALIETLGNVAALCAPTGQSHTSPSSSRVCHVSDTAHYLGS